jgi:hypothetical protein
MQVPNGNAVYDKAASYDQRQHRRGTHQGLNFSYAWFTRGTSG